MSETEWDAIETLRDGIAMFEQELAATRGGEWTWDAGRAALSTLEQALRGMSETERR